MSHFILTKVAQTKKGKAKNIKHAEEIGKSKKAAKDIANIVVKQSKRRK